MTGVTLVLGNIAFTHNDFLTAMQYYLKTMKYAKKSGLGKLLPSVYMNIGSIYLQSGQTKEAQNYYSRSLKGFLERGDSMRVANAYENLGVTYIDLNDWEAAKEYLTKGNMEYAGPRQPLLAENYIGKGICFVDENTGFISTSKGKILKSTDGGTTWSKKNNEWRIR